MTGVTYDKTASQHFMDENGSRMEEREMLMEWRDDGQDKEMGSDTHFAVSAKWSASFYKKVYVMYLWNMTFHCFFSTLLFL